MKKPKRLKYSDLHDMYSADEMDAYLDSLKVDRETVVNIIKTNCKRFWELSRNTKVTPYKVGMLADAIMSAIGGGE